MEKSAKKTHQEHLIEKLEAAKKKWEEDAQKHRELVTEENVADVVAMMTGVPVQRVAQAEALKKKLEEWEPTGADDTGGPSPR